MNKKLIWLLSILKSSKIKNMSFLYFFCPHNIKCLSLYTLHPHFELIQYSYDVIFPIEMILTAAEDTNLTFKKVWITLSWSFILMPSTFIFPPFANLKLSNSLSIFKVSNISWYLQMCFKAAEFITHFVLATSSFVAKRICHLHLQHFLLYTWVLAPSLFISLNFFKSSFICLHLACTWPFPPQ